MAEALDPALPDELSDRAERLLALADARDLQLAAAESCTGGLLSALLTDIPGRSHVFERGFVVYSKHAKCDLLGIDRRQIDECGAVSLETALAMAQGALERSNADVAVAITGFAGPGGDDDEEGLVHFGCARSGFDTAHREEHFGPLGRARIRIAALDVALAMMEEAICR